MCENQNHKLTDYWPLLKECSQLQAVWTATELSTGAIMEAGMTSYDLELRGKWQSGFTLPVTKLRHNPLGVKTIWHTTATGAAQRGAEGNIKKVCKAFLKGGENSIRQKAREERKQGNEKDRKKQSQEQNKKWTFMSKSEKQTGPVRGRGNNKCCSGPSLGWAGCKVTVRVQIQMMSHFLKHTGTSWHTQL